MAEQVLELPQGRWIHFEITATPSQADADKWAMTVSMPGQAPREFTGLAYGSPQFKELTWMGFSSNATAASVWYLDNFEVEGGSR